MDVQGAMRIAAAATVLGALAGCNVSNSSVKRGLARDELERVKVPKHYELLDQGENDSGQETFQYRLYATSRIGPHVPPTEKYVERELLPTFRKGWEVLDSWVGLNENERSECLIVFERPTSADALENFPPEVIDALGDRKAIRLEAWCGDAQHSFD